MCWRQVRQHSVRRDFGLCRFAPRELAWNFNHLHHQSGCHHTYRQHWCHWWSHGIQLKGKLIWLEKSCVAAFFDPCIPRLLTTYPYTCYYFAFNCTFLLWQLSLGIPGSIRAHARTHRQCRPLSSLCLLYPRLLGLVWAALRLLKRRLWHYERTPLVSGSKENWQTALRENHFHGSGNSTSDLGSGPPSNERQIVH